MFTHLEIDRTDVTNIRMVLTEPPAAVPAESVVIQVDSFALTSNHVSYAVAGDILDHWGFFPASEPGGGVSR